VRSTVALQRLLCVAGLALAQFLYAQAVDSGELSNGLYRNAVVGFTYKLPYGWVDRTEDMRQNPNESGQASGKTSAAKAYVLLAAFERPPEAAGNTINSAVIIAAENVSSYPGLKTAAQYFGPFNELTAAQGFNVLNEPYEFPVDAKPIVREDFKKPRSSLTMYQSTLAMLQRGYVLSFTFIGGSDDEVTALIEGLSFNAPKPAAKSHPQPPPK